MSASLTRSTERHAWVTSIPKGECAPLMADGPGLRQGRRLCLQDVNRLRRHSRQMPRTSAFGRYELSSSARSAFDSDRRTGCRARAPRDWSAIKERIKGVVDK